LPVTAREVALALEPARGLALERAYGPLQEVARELARTVVLVEPVQLQLRY